MKNKMRVGVMLNFALVWFMMSQVTQGAMTDQISQFGITWTFDKEYEYGWFANGDYWVVGPVTVQSVSPGWDGEKHGSMLNPVPEENRQGYTDVSLRLSFDDNVREKFPLYLDPSDGIKSLVSTIGLVLDECMGNGYKESLDTAAVLTVVAEPVPDGTFRPPYVNGPKPLHNVSQIQWNLLPLLDVPAGTILPDDIALGDFNDSRLMKRPWIDHGPRGDGIAIHPINNLRHYDAAGTVLPPDVSDMALLVMLNIPEREDFTIRLIQLGIDTYSIAIQSNELWMAHGGGNNGRKWPILFAGIMLNDTGMKNPPETATVIPPVKKFGEDGHTYIGNATPDYPLGKPLWGRDCGGSSVGFCDGKGSKECRDPDGLEDGCSYRTCCTSFGWPGQALAAHLMNATDLWNHSAFFGYVDRWVYEGNPDFGSHVFWNYGSDFVKAMWDTYRGPAYPDGECNGDELLNPENYPLDCEAPEEEEEEEGEENDAQPEEDIQTADKTLLRVYNNVIRPSKGEKSTIRVELKERAHVKVILYDNKGNKVKKIADEEKEAGVHTYYWYGKDDSGNTVGSGIYFVHMEAGGYKETKKIAVVK